MTRGDLFLMCVQTALLKTEDCTNYMAATILAKSALLPEEAYGGVDMSVASVDWVQYVLSVSSHQRKPDWLEAYEEGRRNVVRVSHRGENVAGRWWMHAEQAFFDALEGRGATFPKAMADIVIGRAREVTATRADALLFLEWAKAVPYYEEELPFAFECDPPLEGA